MQRRCIVVGSAAEVPRLKTALDAVTEFCKESLFFAHGARQEDRVQAHLSMSIHPSETTIVSLYEIY